MDKDMGLRAIESTLPPGFRFYPRDEELVCHYLYKKEDWVLCRVFHKGEGESADQDTINTNNTTAGSSSPPSFRSPCSSHVDLPMADAAVPSHEQLLMGSSLSTALLQQEDEYNNSSAPPPLMDMQALLQCNLLEFPAVQEMGSNMEMGFLIEMGFEHSMMMGEAAAGMGRFELPRWQ
ncbi:hypothetical protein Cni_G25528 [Canna indica]|uniref:NAC domain-containing protein n=1 Tax=Canna indica TaxID=4628 RepID=A0AAQ3QQI7_9LILI|nr:hypothetical protein Cni_G25528 [Canna indica]